MMALAHHPGRDSSPAKWPPQSLGSVCDRITVGHVGPMADQYQPEGIPFLRSQNIRPFQIDTAALKSVSAEFHHKLRKSALKPGDVVVVRTGYPGTAAVIPDWLGTANCADLVVMSPGSGLDADYLVAALNSSLGASAVRARLVGSAQQHFNVSAARALVLPLPPLPTQRKIAAVLAVYNDLIENNTRRIQILEEMAQRIYREWFVHFRYPGHEDVPMVESEIGPIPEGWRVTALSSLAQVDKGASYRGSHLTGLGKPMANLKNIRPSGGFVRAGTKGYSGQFTENQAVEPGTLIVANTDLTQSGAVIGSAAVIPRRRFESGGLLSHHLYAIRPISVTLRSYLVHALSSTRFQQFARSRASGTTVLGFRRQDCEAYPVVVPAIGTLEAFTNAVGPIDALAECLADHAENLASTRDLLLPRLVSGELDVGDLDIQMSEAA